MLRYIYDFDLVLILKKKVTILELNLQVFWSNAVHLDEGSVKNNVFFCFKRHTRKKFSIASIEKGFQLKILWCVIRYYA